MPDAGIPVRRESADSSRGGHLPFCSWRNPDSDNYQSFSPYERRVASSGRNSTFRDDELSDRGYSSSGHGYDRNEEHTSFHRTYSPSYSSVRPNVPQGMRKVTSVSSSPSQSSSSSNLSLRMGQIIEHERFGIGEVMNVEGTGEDCKATIRFRNVGDKQLLLRFARFKIIQ